MTRLTGSKSSGKKSARIRNEIKKTPSTRELVEKWKDQFWIGE